MYYYSRECGQARRPGGRGREDKKEPGVYLYEKYKNFFPKIKLNNIDLNTINIYLYRIISKLGYSTRYFHPNFTYWSFLDFISIFSPRSKNYINSEHKKQIMILFKK